MSKPGILGTLQLAATLVFALPIALLGIQFLLDGKTLLGGGFVAVAVLMVVLEEYLTTPTDVPGAVAEKTIGKVAKTPDDEE
ncbi:hypothetical protein M0R88_09725 [Halorussus gelatinilyticus]|uniref:Uncharacterized protein n=1 Tax=Halorussus gelatinilyticus TaxID=2937524 RepID=A0A8U0IDM8_9EURY|nr:hypothetical protein [Halorussus gelatinilyticus]UPV98810.1 hypothetical protein M0R88_09725 [Halorussus gelatinilyticus]